ncbi:MAG: histidine--tRNA ligase [Holosporaceae bacterium]|jgi:histidyl-tRNA synthetase|nr:histidine--tRNA ligase [Holosporaceae bacterium]
MKSSISGFPEFLPNEQIAFNGVIDTIREHFELYGFVPMDTPAVERISTLLAKGNDNEIYGLYRIADEDSKKDLGLRFDLTVPLARYVVENHGQLIFPHKRYQISPVWRGERSQHGRYRQFYQCDIDILGSRELSVEHDAEIVALISEVLLSLKVPSFHTKLNNRKILSGFIKTIALEEYVVEIVRLMDKADKISVEEFEESVKPLLAAPENLGKLKIFLNAEKRGRNSDVLRWLKSLNLGEEYEQGVQELSTVLQILKKLGLEENLVKISTRLARGLAYYTGIIFETTFDENLNDLGSIAGGGRYEDLTKTLSDQSDKTFPGVGGTIGVSRLVPKLIEKGILPTDRLSPGQILVTVQNRELIGCYMKIASKLRRVGVKTETYLHNKSLGAQLTYASKKGYRFVIIANDVELLENKAILRNLKTHDQLLVSTEYFGNEFLELIHPDSHFTTHFCPRV